MPLATLRVKPEAMGLQLASTSDVLRALDAASSISLTAYTLGSGVQGAGRVVDALERAADRGADVVVRLEGSPYDPGGSGNLAKLNAESVAALRAHGIDAALQADPKAPLHLKAAVIDGRVYLDDRNWPDDGPNTIVTTADSDDVSTIQAAMRGEHAADGHLATWKQRAQDLELDTIAYAPAQAVDLESESFGQGPLAALLARRAQAGDTVRLLVAARDLQGNSREAAVLAKLVAAGAQVRVGSPAQGELDEKICLAGTSAWVGSANATAGYPETIDWGMRTRVVPVVGALAARFEQNWSGAQPYVPS